MDSVISFPWCLSDEAIVAPGQLRICAAPADSLRVALRVGFFPEDAPVHPTVTQRFALTVVTQCSRVGAYRPEALRYHDDFKALYEGSNPNKESIQPLQAS
jgi:hypothetical protein